MRIKEKAQDKDTKCQVDADLTLPQCFHFTTVTKTPWEDASASFQRAFSHPQDSACFCYCWSSTEEKRQATQVKEKMVTTVVSFFLDTSCCIIHERMTPISSLDSKLMVLRTWKVKQQFPLRAGIPIRTFLFWQTMMPLANPVCMGLHVGLSTFISIFLIICSLLRPIPFDF